ncbi:MAG TPA: isochorismatase family protein [Kofleriaceae bacterium]|nr:isochorismatase family protein [Kofleriaceae bacterium]
MSIEPLSRTRAALLVIDVQERLAAAMSPEVLAPVVRNTKLLIEAARRLGLPIVVSQQYPKGLGPTIAPLEEALAGHPRLHRFDKLEFSAAGAPEFAALAPGLGRDQWIACGMEAHVCVYQSARGLVGRGYAVHVAADATCSRTKANWQIGVGLVERAGAIATSTEACVFDLLERAGNDDFKALSRAIK